MTTFSFDEILTDEEVAQVEQIWDDWKSSKRGPSFMEIVREQIILPKIERINRVLGEDMDPMYLSLRLQLLMMKRDAEEALFDFSLKPRNIH